MNLLLAFIYFQLGFREEKKAFAIFVAHKKKGLSHELLPKTLSAMLFFFFFFF